jgi:hypothetical protein
LVRYYESVRLSALSDDDIAQLTPCRLNGKLHISATCADGSISDCDEPRCQCDHILMAWRANWSKMRR